MHRLHISEIKAYPNNAKIHTAEQIEQIKKSIQEFGFNDPIGIWHGECVEGHGRIIAATELGIETVPVIRLDELSDEQRKAYTLVHNKLTMNTDFDVGILDIELDDIVDIDMQQFGFEMSEYEEFDESDLDINETVVSFSDHRQKHLGTIYQATNWIYLGLTVTSDTQYFYNGKWTHERTINSKSNRDVLKKTLPKRENSNKFKYIYVFNKKQRKKYLQMALPYPKDKDLTTCDMQVKKKRLSRSK